MNHLPNPRRLFDEINAHLTEQGQLMRAGSIVDATIIAAPSSTKNAKGERDLDMHQTKKWARLLDRAEQLKVGVRAKVEHPFHVVKNLFRHRKVRYKGMAKNQGQLFTLFGLAHLVIAKRSLLDINARGAS